MTPYAYPTSDSCEIVSSDGARLQPTGARFPAPDTALCRAFRSALARRAEADERDDRGENPGAEADQARGQQDRGPPAELEDGASLAPVFFSKLRDARHVARALGDLEAVEGRLRAGLGLHAGDIAGEPEQLSRLLDLDRLARRPDGDHRPGDRRTTDGARERPPIENLAQRAADPFGHM